MPELSDNTNWFEVDSSNNKASPAGWPEGMMPSGVNDSARANMGALKRFWDRLNPVQSITPAAGVWKFNTGNTAFPAAYNNGELFWFNAAAAAAGADQFAINALANKPLYRPTRLGAVALVAGDWPAGQRPLLAYDTSLNGGAGG